MLLDGWGVLAEHALNSGRRDAVAPGDLAKTLALTAIVLDSGMVEFEPIAADMATLEAGTPHAGPHPLDDQTAFQFSDGADDDDDGTAQRAAGVDLLPEADEFDVQPVQIVEHCEEVTS